MELLGDLFLVFCVGLAVWEFILRPLRVADGLGPIVFAIAGAIRSALPVIERIAYWLIVGRPRGQVQQAAATRAAHYVPTPAPEDDSDQARSQAFTNTGTTGSAAFRSPGTVRTDDDDPEPVVQLDRLDAPDLALIVAALERRGYLCLDRSDQELARDLVYRVERQARFQPAGQRSKSAAILEATGMKRGGSSAYKRASAMYDAIVGQPPPAVPSGESRPEQIPAQK